MILSDGIEQVRVLSPAFRLIWCLRVLVKLDVQEVFDGSFKQHKKEASCRHNSAVAQELFGDDTIDENRWVIQCPHDVDCDTLHVVYVDISLGFFKEPLRVFPESIYLGSQSELECLVNEVNLGNWALLPLQLSQVVDCHLIWGFRF